MAIQIIFVMEADEKSRSDYMYIRTVLDKHYNILQRKDIKIMPVFMGGKGNYQKAKVERTITGNVKKYSVNGESKIVYCFDTDKYDSNPEDSKLLNQEQDYCASKGYDFVWFCHDIEEVFLGHSVKQSEKTDIARKFMANASKSAIVVNNLNVDSIGKGKSNLIRVLDKYLIM